MTLFIVLYAFHIWKISNQMLITDGRIIFTFCYQLIQSLFP